MKYLLCKIFLSKFPDGLIAAGCYINGISASPECLTHGISHLIVIICQKYRLPHYIPPFEGKLITKMLPFPVLLYAFIVPLWALIILCTIVRPNPVPFSLVVKKGSKILPMSSGS